jgi:hypothetical protein
MHVCEYFIPLLPSQVERYNNSVFFNVGTIHICEDTDIWSHMYNVLTRK